MGWGGGRGIVLFARIGLFSVDHVTALFKEQWIWGWLGGE